MTTFRDVANAFPSMGWGGLDEMIQGKVDRAGRERDYTKMLGARHREARMTVEARGEDPMLLKTGEGGCKAIRLWQASLGRGITRGWRYI